MNVIIPMTGYGSRFVKAGYRHLKPLIPIYGRPIIEWIVKSLYVPGDNFILICRKLHLDTISGMRSQLLALAPHVTVVEIDDWVKKGPVNDILLASSFIPDDEPCIVNYCDVYFLWDYKKFLSEVKLNDCDGAIPCYTGFHPNLLPKNNVYASCLTDTAGNLDEIREKYSFESEKSRGKHSAGVYYFKRGKLMKKVFKQLIRDDNNINGEFYVSLPYNYMVKEGMKVWVPTNIDQYCCWGTPEDLEESLFYMDSIINNGGFAR